MIKKIALDAFGKALTNEAKKNKKLIAISVDLKRCMQIRLFF